jgi:hypothetical protein
MKAAAALLATLACSAGAQEITIKDFALGGSLKGEGARAGLTCRDAPLPSSSIQYCALAPARPATPAAQTIAGVPATDVYFMGYDDVLGEVRFSFSPASFAIVRDALKEKYPALECKDSTVQTRAGASFDQTVCRYETAAAEIVVERRSSKVTQSQVRVTTKAHMAAGQADQSKRASTGKKDL